MRGRCTPYPVFPSPSSRSPVQNPDPVAAKQALRERFVAARRVLSEAEVAAHSARICEQVAALPEIRRAGTVHVFWPIQARREVDTRPLIHRLRAEGKTIVLPIVAPVAGRPLLRHARFEGESRMQTSSWGISEPEGTAEVPPEALDAVVVPALGAGRNGHRIGHGRGYYDLFLAGLRVPTVCVLYAACLLDHVPAEPHDVPLDVLVTEREVWRIPRS